MYQSLRGTIYALIAGICWGFSGTVGQFLFSHTAIDSGWLTTVRLLVSGLILLVMAAIQRPQSVTGVWKNRRDALQLVFFGIAGLMAVQYCYMEAIFYSDSGTATAVQYTGEAMLLVYTCITARRLPKRSEFFGLVLSPAGLFWGLTAAVALMIYTASPCRLIEKYGSISITAQGMLIGGLALGLLLRIWQIPGTYTPQALLGTAAITLIGTVLGFTIYLKSTVLIGPLKAGLIAAVETVSAPFFSRVWLKTPFQPVDYLGFLCILSMVFLISLPELRKERAQAPQNS